MKNFLFFFFFVFEMSFSQAPTVDWMKRFGGTNNEYFRSVIQTQDGGFLVGGYSLSDISGIKSENLKGFNNDYLVLKLNAGGVIEWQKDLGGGGTWAFTELTGEKFTSLTQANDGSYYICGYSDSPILGDKTEGCYGSDDYWIVKLSNSGAVLWDKTIGGSSADRCYSIDSSPDGGCIISGESYSGISGNKTENSRGSWDYWVVKLSASGAIDWQKTIGGSGSDSSFSIVSNDDGTFMVGGVSNSNISDEKSENSKGGGDYWILKLDANGQILWQKTIGSNATDNFYKLVKGDSCYLVCGVSASDISFDKTEASKGATDFWIVKIDDFGNIVWDKTIGGSDTDMLYGAATIPSGGFVLVGDSYSGISGDKTESNYGGIDAWVVRIDASGSVLWDKDFGTVSDEGFNQVVALTDGSMLFGGASFSNVSGNVTVAGYGGIDYWLTKLQPEDLRNESFISSSLQIYPNPTSSIVNIKSANENIQSIQLLDIQGRVVVSQIITTSICQIDLSNYQKGTYFLKLTTTNESKVVKVVKN